MTLDLTKPIRTKDGRAAKYLGHLSTSYGRSMFASLRDEKYEFKFYYPKEFSFYFENIPGHDLSTLTDKNYVRVKS